MTRPVRWKKRHRVRGFTLVELLVATAVMMLLLLGMAMITGSVLNTTQFSHQRIDASQHARAVLDAMAGDLSRLVNKRGMTVFVKQNASDNAQFAFLTQSRGPAGTTGNRFTAVNYRLTNGELIRSMVPMTWSAVNFVPEGTKAVSSATQSSIVADRILRLEAMAVLDDGSMVPLTTNATWKSATVDGQIISDGFQGLILSDPPINAAKPRVRALVIAVATLDDRAYAFANVPNMGASLPSPQVGESPVEVWIRAVANGQLNGFPKPAVAALHFAQSTFELK